LYPDWEHGVGLLLHAGGISIGGGCEEGRARDGGRRLLALVPHQDEAGGVNDKELTTDKIKTSEIMTANEFFKSLIGFDISEARKRLGYWWRSESCRVNGSTGYYVFERAAGGQVALRTEKNVVVSEHHNIMAEIYQKNDLKQ